MLNKYYYDFDNGGKQYGFDAICYNNRRNILKLNNTSKKKNDNENNESNNNDEKEDAYKESLINYLTDYMLHQFCLTNVFRYNYSGNDNDNDNDSDDDYIDKWKIKYNTKAR